jgi:transposase
VSLLGQIRQGLAFVFGDNLVATIRADGLNLLTAVCANHAPLEVRAVTAVEILQGVWLQNYVATDGGPRWRTSEDGLPPAMRFISSRYDLDAHYAVKRTNS